ncbi:MAG TPA: response regulator, partial [Thermoanaerobaculia bacterium]|nr:response regulator [Thermoanaerobaculia bacterium]
HVLVSDIGMPEQDGYALIQEVRQLPAESGGTVPAVALTAFARAEDRRRALRAGFQRHAAKPVDIRDLTLMIAGLARGLPAEPLPPN